jgi:hypothetical protein
MTGVLTYLSTRPYGATPDELADALGLTTSKARGYAKIVRDWLGTNPRTGQPTCPTPAAPPKPSAAASRIYQVLRTCSSTPTSSAACAPAAKPAARTASTT